MSTLKPVAVHEYEPALASVSAMRATVRELRAMHYDAGISTEHTSITMAAFLCAAGIPWRIGFEPLCDCPQARFLTDPVRLDESQSQWQSLLRLARAVDPELPEEIKPLPVPVGPEAERMVDRWWGDAVGREHGMVLALHLGCGSVQDFRRWPVPRFVEFAERLRAIHRDLTVVLTGQPVEQPLADEFVRRYSGRAVLWFSFHSVEETAGLLKRCDLLVSADTGVMHLGAAMGTPTVGIFGPNTPAQWAPLGERATYVQQAGVPCAPCIRNFQGRFPIECANEIKSACMLSVSTDEVIRAAWRVMRRPSAADDYKRTA